MTRRQGPGDYYQGHSQEDDRRSEQRMQGWGRGSEDPERNHTGKECLLHTVYSIRFLSVFQIKAHLGLFLLVPKRPWPVHSQAWLTMWGQHLKRFHGSERRKKEAISDTSPTMERETRAAGLTSL